MRDDEKSEGKGKIRDLASAYRKKKGKITILPNPLLGLSESTAEQPIKQPVSTMEVAKDKKPFHSVLQDTIDSWKDIKKEGYRPIEIAEEPKKKSLEELFAEMQKAREDREQLIAETEPETMAFKARGGGGRVMVVSPSMGEDKDKWRMTHFDDKGPVGHVENLSFPDAMETAHQYGANLKDRLPPDAFAEGGGVQPITGVTFDDSAEAEERYKQKLAMWAKQYEESQKPQTVFPKAYDPEGTARPEEKRGKHLVHYSQSGKVFSKLDPKFFGEGRAGQERERGNIIPRTYYYEAESSPEAVVRSGAKHRYVVPRPDRILDLASDEGAHWVRRAGGDMSELEQMLKDHGFAGYKNSAHPELPHAVALFHEQEPIHITPKFAEGGTIVSSAQEPGMSFNKRQFGPYNVSTQIQALPGGEGRRVVHDVELPEGQAYDEASARRVSKELQWPVERINTIRPGQSYLKGNMYADGGRVMMQEGGDPGEEIDISQSPLFQQTIQETPTPSEGQQPAEESGRIPVTKSATIWNTAGETPRMQEVPHESVQAGILSGFYSFDDAAKVPVFNENGELGTLPGNLAKEGFQSNRYRYATPAAIQEYRYGGAGETWKAAGEAALRGVISPPAAIGLEKLLGVEAEDILGREKAHPKLSHAIEATAAFAPLVLSLGEWGAARAGIEGLATGLGKAAKIAASTPYMGGIQKIGELVPLGGGWIKNSLLTAARGTLEGAVFGASDQLGHAMLNDPDSTLSNALVGIGLSAALGGGFGLGFGLLGAAARGLGFIEPPGGGGGGPPPLGGEPPSGRPDYYVDPDTGMPIKVSGEPPAPSFRSALEESGVPLARPTLETEVPFGAAEPPEGIFWRKKEPIEKIEIEPATGKSADREAFEEITGQTQEREPLLTAEGKPKEGLYLEGEDRWVEPQDMEAYMKGDPLVLAKYHPELGDLFNKINAQEGLRQRFNRSLVTATEDARETERAIITLGKQFGIDIKPDDIPLVFLTNDSKVHHLYDYLMNMPGAHFFPLANYFGKIDQIYKATFASLLGKFHGKTSLDLGQAYQKQILNRFIHSFKRFKEPYEDIDRLFSGIKIKKSKIKGLISSLEAKIKDPSSDISVEEARYMRNAMANLRRLMEFKGDPTMLNFRTSMKNIAKTAFARGTVSATEKQILNGYRNVWGAMKDFETKMIDSLTLEEAQAMFPEFATQLKNKWQLKLDADKEYKAFADDLHDLAEIAGANKSERSSTRAIMDFFRSKGADQLFRALDIRKMHHDKLLKLQSRFPDILSSMRYVEKQNILNRAQQAQSMNERNSLLKDLKALRRKELADYVFDTPEEQQQFEMLMQMAKHSNWIRNFSQTNISEQISKFLEGGPAVMAAKAKGVATAPFLLAQARKSLNLGRGYGAKPPKMSKSAAGMAGGASAKKPKGEPEQYAEGGMVEGPIEPQFMQDAFARAVNAPPKVQQAQKLAGAIIKGDKAITNSVKSVFDPKSTYKIAQANPKNVEKLKGYIDHIHKNPSALLETGSEVLPEVNTAMTTTLSQAVKYIKSLEPPKPQNLPFDSGVKAPPSTHSDIYNHVLRVAEQPMSVMHKVKNGTVIPEEVGAVKAIYPALYQRLQNQITEHLIEAGSTGATIPYRTKIGLSAFLGSPIDTTFTPESIQSAQPMQQNQPPQGAQTGVQPKRSTSALGKMATMAQTPGQARMSEKSSGK